MGMTLSPVKFWDPKIRIGEVDSASSVDLLYSEGKTLEEVLNCRPGNLFVVLENPGRMILEIPKSGIIDREFIDFMELTPDTMSAKLDM